MIIYFSKVNLNSEHIFEAYKKEEIFNDVKNKILTYFKSEMEIIDRNNWIDVNGNINSDDITYRITVHKKTDDDIHGVMYKDSTIYHKVVNPKTKIIESHPVPNVEDIEFYYNVGKEFIGFHTRNRFGYSDFNDIMSKFLNQCMEKNNIDYRFYIALYNEGVDMESIKNSIKSIGPLKQIIFKFQPPNPNEDFLDELKNQTTDMVKELEESNSTGKSVIFDSKGVLGLNFESCSIQDNFNSMCNMQKGINEKVATKNGYASLKAIARNGDIYTTEEHKPLKKEIQNPQEFLHACKNTILNIFRNRGDENT